MNEINTRKEFLDFHRPKIGEEEIQEVIDTLKKGWITTGPKTKLFEEKFGEYIGCPNTLALNSCTAALSLTLRLLGINENHEVITTPMTFAATANGTVTAGLVELPSDMYVIADQGVTTSAGILVDEVERNAIAIMARSEVAPTELYPVYEWFGSTLKVYPTTITSVNFRYIRKPLNPKWTYTIVANKEMYDPSNASFQDFELDSSEFYNIILRMLTYFGINLREPEVVKIAELMKDKDNVKN